MSTSRKIDSHIAGFIDQHCLLDPDAWTSHYELYDAYIRWDLFTPDSLDKRDFVRALRTVPGYKGEKRGTMSMRRWGARGIRLDELGPFESHERVFKLLGKALAGREFEYLEVTRLARSNPAIHDSLVEAGCIKPKCHARYWLMAVRDKHAAGYKLLRISKASDQDVWRWWQFKQIKEMK